MKFFAALSIFVALVSAAPTLEDAPLEARDADFVGITARGEYCPVANDPDWKMVQIGYNTCRSRGCTAREMLAMMETGTVESNWQNLRCGDQDSEGIYQQRASQGAWGTQADIRNPQTATNNFLNAMLKCSRENPGVSAGKIAQCAQRSDLPLAYDRAESRARGYLQEATRRWGNSSPSNGGSANVGSNPGSSSGGSSGCAASVKAVKGDTCNKIANRGKVSVNTLKGLNSSLNKNCTNIKIGQSYCTKKGSAPAPAKGNSGGCKTVKAVKGDSCSKVAGRGKIALSKFMSLNKSTINSKCTNLTVGRSYCVN